MSTTTNNLKLTKPESSEQYNISVFNTNMDIIDSVGENKYYPVGVILTTSNASNPSTYLGFGTWSCIYEDYDYIYLGSQNIYPEWTASAATGKTVLLGAYDNSTIGAFSLPIGDYTRKVRVTASIWTSGGNHGRVYLNSIQMVDGNTWSGNTFRQVCYSNWYSLSEIGKETTYGYSKEGINLYVQNTESGNCSIRDITVHNAFVSNDKIYKWKRTA